MGIQTQQRVAQALDNVEMLMAIVNSLTKGLTQAEHDIRELKERLAALEPKRKQRWPSTPNAS